jgi:regulator of protease activity HflC (stomatin/prohibitin superfamily)
LFLFILAILFAILSAIIFFVKEADGIKLRRWATIPLVLAAVCLAISTVRTVSPGTVAVPVTFGTTSPAISPGVNILPPWTGLEEVTTRTQEYTMTGNHAEGQVQGNDAVPVSGLGGSVGAVDATVFYHVNEKDAERLYRETKDINDLIRVKTRTCIRDAFGTYDLVDSQNSKRGEVAAKIDECVHKEIEPRGVTVESFQLRDVRLNDQLQASVQNKLNAQQNAEAKKFELESARQDAVKKGIESKAISDSQQIVKCGGTATKQDDGSVLIVPNTGSSCQNNLTPEYLQWYYIDLFGKLVNSPNHDTVIIPAPSQGNNTTQPLIQIPNK